MRLERGVNIAAGVAALGAAALLTWEVGANIPTMDAENRRRIAAVCPSSVFEANKTDLQRQVEEITISRRSCRIS